jgi:hypothetical protein
MGTGSRIAAVLSIVPSRNSPRLGIIQRLARLLRGSSAVRVVQQQLALGRRCSFLPSRMKSWTPRSASLAHPRGHIGLDAVELSAARVTPPACTTERKICRSPRSIAAVLRSHTEMHFIIIIHFT